MSDTAQQAVPAEQRCVWPGCTRRRAAGRATGSGRQKEYCLQADPPEAGGSPVHNARNRWASLRSAANRAAQHPADSAEDARGDGTQGIGSDTAGSADVSAGHQGTGTGGGQSAGSVRDELLFSATKKRASDLLEQARRQHAAATESLRAEHELYQRLGQQLTALADPASLDLEIAAVASRAGASVAQAEEDAARARRAQLAAERERDDAARLRAHADAAAEQLAADAEAAELALAERTAEFDLDRATFVARAREAEELADRSRAVAAEAQAAAEAAEARAAADVAQARERASAEIASAQRARGRGDRAGTARSRRRSGGRTASGRRGGRRGASARRRRGGTGAARCRRPATRDLGGDRGRQRGGRASPDGGRRRARRHRRRAGEAPRPPAPGPTRPRPRLTGRATRSAGSARSCAGSMPPARPRSPGWPSRIRPRSSPSGAALRGPRPSSTLCGTRRDRRQAGCARR